MGIKKKRERFLSIQQRVHPDFISQIKETNGDINSISDLILMKISGHQKINSNWKIHHETFRVAIKAAKEGKILSDGTIDDRVPCQFCGRKFKADVALRHLPLCQKSNSKFNFFKK